MVVRDWIQSWHWCTRLTAFLSSWTWRTGNASLLPQDQFVAFRVTLIVTPLQSRSRSGACFPSRRTKRRLIGPGLEPRKVRSLHNNGKKVKCLEPTRREKRYKINQHILRYGGVEDTTCVGLSSCCISGYDPDATLLGLARRTTAVVVLFTQEADIDPLGGGAVSERLRGFSRVFPRIFSTLENEAR